MNKSLVVKLLLLGVYFLVALFFFYDEHFIIDTTVLNHFSTIDFMFANISFGIIISATIYNFSLYIYLKNKQYLYYSLAQLSSLLFLVNLDSLFITPFDEIFGLKSIQLFDISQLLMLIFSLLFLESFFQNYEGVVLDKLIRAIITVALLDIVISFIFSHSFFIKLIPIFIPIFLVLSEVIAYIKHRDLPFYLIVIAWSIVILVSLLEYFDILNITFPFLHLAIALESILLSLAIAYKFKLLEEEKEKQKTLLFQQSRLASMGEMVSAIVHQWRQPLNTISFGLMNIKRNSIGQEKNLKTIKKLNEQVQYMSDTIEGFRNFYNPSRIKEDFSVYQAVQNSYLISSVILKKSDITFSIKLKNDFILYGHQNELEQVILNLINNAKDELIHSKIEEPTIVIIIDKGVIIVQDNGKGIQKEHKNKIFDPYFSTKKKSDGIGLYISKMIIEKEFSGEISIHSITGDNKFFIKFHKSDFL